MEVWETNIVQLYLMLSQDIKIYFKILNLSTQYAVKAADV